MRFLHLLRARHVIFKKIRIGFTLSKSSFKSVFFSHQRYLILCLLLAAVQFIHLKITGLIHHRLTVGLLMTELLAGENFFEILWHDAHFTLSSTNFLKFFNFVGFLYLEIILIFFILCAAAYYTLKQGSSLWNSLRKSMSRWQAICGWGLIELCAQGLSSHLGNIGALLYFAWNIITIFDVQILAFDHLNAYQILKKSWGLFKNTFSEVVAFDVIIEGLLILIGIGIYFISEQYIAGINLAEFQNYNDFVVFLILYLISSIMLLEVVIFTNLYKVNEKN